MENFQTIAAKPEKYDFRCTEITVKPRLEIISKATGKVIGALNAIELVYLNGTMDQKYSDDFFADVEKKCKLSFLQHMRQSNVESEK